MIKRIEPLNTGWPGVLMRTLLKAAVTLQGRCMGAMVILFILALMAQCGTMRGERMGGMSAAKERAYKSEDKKDYLNEAEAGDYEEDASPKVASKPVGQKPPPAAEKRMVIYSAQYSCEVESVRSAMEQVDGIVKKYDGFIESTVSSDSYLSATVVIRVPVRHFDAALEAVERLGRVLDKNVTASDVTMEYNDMALRMDTAKRFRDRLYELLKRTTRAEEKVKILREIDRLTELIDTLNAKMASMSGRARFSTITLRLSAKVRDVSRRYMPSPFTWIAMLDPEKRTIYDDGKRLRHDVPAGFFSLAEPYYRKSGQYLYSNPGNTTGIRVGVVENYPPADAAFWDEAFRIDLENRHYIVEKTDTLSGQYGNGYRRFVIRLTSGRFYTVSVSVAGERIIVVEALYESRADYEKYDAAITAFIKTVRLSDEK